MMTRKEVMVRAIGKELTWIQAAEICGITARQMRRPLRGMMLHLDGSTHAWLAD